MNNTLKRTGNPKIEKMVIGTVLAHVLLGMACFAAEPQGALSQLGESANKMSIDMPCMCLPSFCPEGCGQITLHPTPVEPGQEEPCDFLPGGCGQPYSCNTWGVGCEYPEWPVYQPGTCDQSGCFLVNGSNVCFDTACPPLPPIEEYQEKSRGAVPESLARLYKAQPGMKKILSAHFMETGDELKAGLMSQKGLRVLSDGKAVYLVLNKTTVKIDNPALAARVYAAIYPTLRGNVIPENKLLVEAAVTGAIGCMTSEDCWGAVVDGARS